jgi:hypothetical protein
MHRTVRFGEGIMLMRIFVSVVTVALLVSAAYPAFCFSQQALSPSKAAPPTSWQSGSVVYVAGLADVKPGITGTLGITPDALTFSTKSSHGEIQLNRITGISTGQERVATGGMGAKIVRKIPIFGIGAVTGAATNKSVDVLTVEYRDGRGGYHGAVFEVPKTRAANAQQQLLSVTQPAPVELPKDCDGSIAPRTLVVLPIVATGINLPAEYRVLLYEQMVQALKRSSGNAVIIRVGDTAAACAATRLQLSVTAFKKGNEAVRASTGPVGLFVGATSVKFQVDLDDLNGKELFSKALKESKHGDADSLNVTQDLAKSVVKRLEKARQIGTSSGT